MSLSAQSVEGGHTPERAMPLSSLGEIAENRRELLLQVAQADTGTRTDATDPAARAVFDAGRAMYKAFAERREQQARGEYPLERIKETMQTVYMDIAFFAQELLGEKSKGKPYTPDQEKYSDVLSSAIQNGTPFTLAEFSFRKSGSGLNIMSDDGRIVITPSMELRDGMYRTQPGVLPAISVMIDGQSRIFNTSEEVAHYLRAQLKELM